MPQSPNPAIAPAPAAEVGFYRPTESFRAQPEHVAVMRRDNGELIAITGYSDYRDPAAFADSLAHAAVYSAAWEMLSACLSLAAASTEAEVGQAREAAARVVGSMTDRMNGLHSYAAPDCDMQAFRRAALDIIAERASR